MLGPPAELLKADIGFGKDGPTLPRKRAISGKHRPLSAWIVGLELELKAFEGASLDSIQNVALAAPQQFRQVHFAVL